MAFVSLYLYSTYLSGEKCCILNGKCFNMSLDIYFSKASDNMPRNTKNSLMSPDNADNEGELTLSASAEILSVGAGSSSP